MDCRVVVEAAVPVYDVESADEAIRIAISKTGEMLNPELNYVEISMRNRHCPHCGEELDPAFLAADESLVALELEMTVFNVEREEHASRIARKEIGQRLENIPLDVLEVEIIPDEDEEVDDTDDAEEAAGSDEGATDEDESDDVSTDDQNRTDNGETAAEGEGDEETRNDGGSDDDDVLPEFDELLE